MTTLLDIAEAAKEVAQDPGKSTLALLASLAGSIYGTAKIVHWFEQKRTKKAMAAIGPVAPAEPESPEAWREREELRARAAKAENEANLGRTLWKLQDTEKRLAESVAEQNNLRNALVRARVVRDEQAVMIAGLRADVAGLRADNERLRLELDTATTVTEDDILTLTNDAHEERIPTPILPPSRRLT